MSKYEVFFLLPETEKQLQYQNIIHNSLLLNYLSSGWKLFAGTYIPTETVLLVSLLIFCLVILMKSNQSECFFLLCDSHKTRSGKITYQVKNQSCKSALLAIFFCRFALKKKKKIWKTARFYLYVHFCSSNCLFPPFRNLKILFSPRHIFTSDRGGWVFFFSSHSERSWNQHIWFCQTGAAI